VSYEKAIYEALSRRPPVLAAIRRNIGCAKLIRKAIEDAHDVVARLFYHNIRYAALLNIFEQVEMRPAAVLYRDSGGLFEHGGRENVLYSATDASTNAPLTDKYSAFERIDIALRFPLWFAENTQQTVPKGLLERLNKSREALARKKGKDDETDALVQRAKALIDAMKELNVKLDHLHDTINDEDSFNRYDRCINEIVDEMQKLLSIWDR